MIAGNIVTHGEMVISFLAFPFTFTSSWRQTIQFKISASVAMIVAATSKGMFIIFPRISYTEPPRICR